MFKNPRLNRVVELLRLDKKTLIALADLYYFPTELIDDLPDFLESELLGLIVNHGKEKILVEPIPIDCESTDDIKQEIRKGYKGSVYLTDEFMSEYFGLPQGMTEPQLDFYERTFRRIKHDIPDSRTC